MTTPDHSGQNFRVSVTRRDGTWVSVMRRFVDANEALGYGMSLQTDASDRVEVAPEGMAMACDKESAHG